ncbi:Auxin response factor 16, partial [Mucuna pruriens]
MQPPAQELLAKDWHNNTRAFRHIYRGQPKKRQPTLSRDSMHIDILAAAAHAVVNNNPFIILHYPRISPAELAIPLAKYNKATYTQVGMRFRMTLELRISWDWIG